MVVKLKMRYLKGIDDFGLYYKNNEKFELNAYIDVDWGGTLMTGKEQLEEHYS